MVVPYLFRRAYMPEWPGFAGFPAFIEIHSADNCRFMIILGGMNEKALFNRPAHIGSHTGYGNH